MPSEPTPITYAGAGVDVEAGDRAVALMRASVGSATRPEVLGGLGGFAGMFDASVLAGMTRPVLATSTDGVGTKVAIAQAMDKHDTIGFDLVGEGTQVGDHRCDLVGAGLHLLSPIRS